MNALNRPDEQWPSCERGTLTKIGAVAKGRQRRQTTLRAAAWTCSILLVAVGVWAVVRPGPANEQEFNFGGIACGDVRANMAEYRMQRLPPKLSEQIATHIKQCPACQEFMANMQRKQAAADLRPRRTACNCPTCRQRLELAMLANRDAARTQFGADADSLKIVNRVISISQGN